MGLTPYREVPEGQDLQPERIMTRLSLVLMCVAYTIISAGTAFAQYGGTVRGQIVDTTELQNPIEDVEVIIVAEDGTEFKTTTNAKGDYKRSNIPAGRYLISIYKDGYRDRLGKPVTVVNGGDHYVPLKMTKHDNILSVLIKKAVSLYGILFLCGITALVTFLITKRWMIERYAINENP